jgi:hypothetical protein
MRARLDSPQGKACYELRSQTIEPVIGDSKTRSSNNRNGWLRQQRKPFKQHAHTVSNAPYELPIVSALANRPEEALMRWGLPGDR